MYTIPAATELTIVATRRLQYRSIERFTTKNQAIAENRKQSVNSIASQYQRRTFLIRIARADT